jgi:hypothetical protein
MCVKVSVTGQATCPASRTLEYRLHVVTGAALYVNDMRAQGLQAPRIVGLVGGTAKRCVQHAHQQLTIPGILAAHFFL